MPVYTYRGVNRTGTNVVGERAAASKAEVASMLRRENINVSKLSEKGKEFNIPTFGTGVDFKGWRISSTRMMSSAYSSAPTQKAHS